MYTPVRQIRQIRLRVQLGTRSAPFGSISLSNYRLPPWRNVIRYTSSNPLTGRRSAINEIISHQLNPSKVCSYLGWDSFRRLWTSWTFRDCLLCSLFSSGRVLSSLCDLTSRHLKFFPSCHTQTKRRAKTSKVTFHFSTPNADRVPPRADQKKSSSPLKSYFLILNNFPFFCWPLLTIRRCRKFCRLLLSFAEHNCWLLTSIGGYLRCNVRTVLLRALLSG